MSSGPLVSVLIPCYNAHAWIAATLESVYQQSWPRIEVIVVDDGSTDASLRVLEPFVARGLKLIAQPNRGQTAALNRALLAAQGDFIQFLDADDLLGSAKIEEQVQRLLSRRGAIATSRWARFRHDPSEARFPLLPTDRDMAAVDWLVANWADGGGMMYPAMWLLPRHIVDRIGPWREDLTLVNDTEYFCRAVLAADQVLFCSEALTYYRSALPGSLSGQKTPAAWRSYHQVLETCESRLLAREDSERTRRVCSMLWQRFSYGCYPYERDLATGALNRAAALHPARLPLEGGKLFHVLSRTIGWKRARVLQKLTGRP